MGEKLKYSLILRAMEESWRVSENETQKDGLLKGRKHAKLFPWILSLDMRGLTGI